MERTVEETDDWRTRGAGMAAGRKGGMGMQSGKEGDRDHGID